jgi:uncharacterized protein with HEPN domain
MRNFDPQQCLADILSNLQEARGFLGDKTLDDLRSDGRTLDCMRLRMQFALETYWRIVCEKGEAGRANEIEARYPDVPWRRFRSLADTSRNDDKKMTAKFLWDIFKPGGIAALVEGAVQQELMQSQIPSTVRKASPSPSRRK